MNQIATAERDCYEEMWGVTTYADKSYGVEYAPTFASLAPLTLFPCGITLRPTVLDAGCGSGKGSLALKALGYDVTMCDLTDAGLILEARSLPFFKSTLWEPITKRYAFGGAYDYVYGTDVMEHLPTAFVALAITRMLAVAKRGVFFSVALIPDHMGVWVGRPLHQTVQPFTWWRDLCRELGTVTDARDLMHTAILFVEPKR